MDCLPDVKPFIYVLVILFGMGSWVSVNGLWVELPILVNQSPESWNLPSYMTILVQIANIGPFLYMILNKFFPNKIKEKHGVFAIVTIGITSSLLLVFLWRETSYIGGVKHSTGLFLAVFLLSLVDCTSSVVFLPYMTLFKPEYISALYIGESLSGLVPSLVALGQGVGKTICVNVTETVNQTTNSTHLVSEYVQPNFPAEDFFYFLLSIMVVCGLAFTLLHYLPYSKQEHVSNHPDILADVKFVNAESASYKYTEFNDPTDSQDSQIDISYMHQRRLENNKGTFIYFLILMASISALTNGVIPNIQSYATIPYGSKSYHLAVTLSNIVNPLVCFVAFFLPTMTKKIISLCTFLGVGSGVYILVIAAESPNPPLQNVTVGAVLVVFMSVFLAATMSFSKVSIASVLRRYGRQALLWCGIVTQVGAFVGAVIMFIVVNKLKLFHQNQPCT